MKIRERVELRADFPNDDIEDDRDIIQFGGRNLAEALGEILEGLGCKVSVPEYAGEHGWEFDFYIGERRFWCQATDMQEDAMFIFKDMAWVIGFWFSRPRPNPVFADLLTRVNAALALDSRFGPPLWYPLIDNSNGPGFPNPVSGEA